MKTRPSAISVITLLGALVVLLLLPHVKEPLVLCITVLWALVIFHLCWDRRRS